jgi:hypothetical protein
MKKVSFSFFIFSKFIRHDGMILFSRSSCMRRNLLHKGKSSILLEALHGLKSPFFKRNEGAVKQFFGPSYWLSILLAII